MRLHWKIALGALFVSVAAIVAGAIYIAPALRKDVTSNIADVLREETAVLQSVLEKRSAEELTTKSLQPWARALGRGGISRITIVAPDGRVLADSDVSVEELPSVENHGDRPEVLAAHEEGEGVAQRRSGTVDVKLLYVARRVRMGKGFGVVRVAYPLSAVNEAVTRVTQVLWGAVVFAFILASILSVFVSRWVAQPLRRLASAAQEIADGDLSVRAETDSGDEVGELARSFNEMVARLESLIGVIRNEREQAQRILATVDEGIILLDERDFVVAGNRVFVDLFKAPEQLKGRSALELVRSDAIQRGLTALREGEERYEQEFVLEAPLGERRFELVAAPVLESGVRTGAVLVFRDVTRTRRLEEVRKEFVANVSHELRTPLTSIRGYAETLSGKLQGDETLARFADSIVRSAERLSALVNDLLELSRLERPEFTPRKENRDLGEELRNGIGQFQDRAAGRKIELVFEPEEFDHTCSFDVRLIDQVLTNLLDNAFKYTPDGGEICVSTEPREGAIRVCVEDTGPGIPEKDIPRLFERFYRVDKARSRELGGTGLGLAIVKHIVERHGGKVGVENRAGGGTRFWFELPA
ncbi:MAG: HAMP domain-containing protein [Chrysiogenetes bacterium]|nr:HAMP domain-containing protein [Chrysiogenetes bacterium]